MRPPTILGSFGLRRNCLRTRTGILILDVGRWQCAVDIVVIVEGECDLFEVIIALDALRSATCSGGCSGLVNESLVTIAPNTGRIPADPGRFSAELVPRYTSPPCSPGTE